MPYQPAGLWEELSAKGFKYIEADSDDLYRRSLYTFWRRTIPSPSMMNFDNASREICSVKLSVTNTPLQAMNLMNDPTFVEATRALGERMLTEGGTTVRGRLRHGFKFLLAREPEPQLLSILEKGYADYRARFKKDRGAAAKLIAVGASPLAEDVDPVELAAHTAVASVLLNLDETVTNK